MGFTLAVKEASSKAWCWIAHSTKSEFKCKLQSYSSNNYQIVKHDTNPVAPVSYMLINDFSLVDK